MYLLLPLESYCVEEHDTTIINWNAIFASASVVKFMRDIYSPGLKCNTFPNYTHGSSEIACCKPDTIHFANCCANFQSIKNSVVLAIHTGKIYSVLHVVVGSSADSPFDGNSEKSPSDFLTYIDYFRKKYVSFLNNVSLVLFVIIFLVLFTSLHHDF